MKVSVVIPTFNSGRFVTGAVESALAQTRAPDEVIVVDDGSTDDTSTTIARFYQSVRYIRKENGGVSSARNRGVAEATGDLIGFLDADDVWHPRKLEVQIAALASRQDLGLIGSWTYPWPADRHPDRPLPGEKFDLVEVPEDDLLIRNCLVTSTVLVRKEVLQAAGEFDPKLHGPEDYDLWLRVARLAPIANLDVAVTGYRLGTPGSLSKNAVRMEAGMRLILDKLDAAGVFRGRNLFRRKVRAHYHYLWGYMHREAGHRLTAAKLVATSLMLYPLAYSRAYVRYPLGRVRLLLNSIFRRSAAVNLDNCVLDAADDPNAMSREPSKFV
jgi:glycosyltransferase involved in cell wall biosynthesis